MTTGEIVATVAVIGLALNGGAIIWGAAKLASAVEHLEKTVIEIKSIVMSVQEIVHNLIARIAVVEDRLSIPTRRRTLEKKES